MRPFASAVTRGAVGLDDYAELLIRPEGNWTQSGVTLVVGLNRCGRLACSNCYKADALKWLLTGTPSEFGINIEQ